MIKHTFVDLDGVLANFNQAAADVFGIPYPTRAVVGWEWIGDQRPDLKLRGFHEELAKYPHLYANLEPYPWHSQLVALLDLHAPGWTLLTSAIQDPHSWSGKAEWVAQHLGVRFLSRLTVAGTSGGNKHLIARPGYLLIDDRLENCSEWEKAGGTAFYWKSYTPDWLDAAQDQLHELEVFFRRNA